jgi:hypothetical protein
MGYRSKKLSLGAISLLRLSHRVLRKFCCVFGLFFGGGEGVFGEAALEQETQLLTITIQ